MNARRLLWVLATALLVSAANVGVSILWIWIYSHMIDPGHDLSYYQDYASAAAPWSGILAGAALVFLAARWLAGRWEPAFAMTAALSLWLAYAALDLALVSMVGLTPRLAALAVVSHTTKLGAAYAAARTAFRGAAPAAGG